MSLGVMLADDATWLSSSLSAAAVMTLIANKAAVVGEGGEGRVRRVKLLEKRP